MSASRYQVVNQDNHRYNDQKVDQATADVQCEAQEPQNQKNYEDCPKHI